jgi:hypothetical protein
MRQHGRHVPDRGVATQYAARLEATGVDSVKESKHPNATNLAQALHNAHVSRKLVRLLPTEIAVTTWIEQAKTLATVVMYSSSRSFVTSSEVQVWTL